VIVDDASDCREFIFDAKIIEKTISLTTADIGRFNSFFRLTSLIEGFIDEARYQPYVNPWPTAYAWFNDRSRDDLRLLNKCDSPGFVRAAAADSS
jgi:hypothetical protein